MVGVLSSGFLWSLSGMDGVFSTSLSRDPCPSSEVFFVFSAISSTTWVLAGQSNTGIVIPSAFLFSFSFHEVRLLNLLALLLEKSECFFFNSSGPFDSLSNILLAAGFSFATIPAPVQRALFTNCMRVLRACFRALLSLSSTPHSIASLTRITTGSKGTIGSVDESAFSSLVSLSFESSLDFSSEASSLFNSFSSFFSSGTGSGSNGKGGGAVEVIRRVSPANALARTFSCLCLVW
mmetsp:Transcript_17807/g.28387  ORF Transcript_17807/g.28387 Transcript_17807/m.28387 type:complete len:236 (+) Transcript_17807:2436-3143(+)